mgnify:CR=1 FL=1
MFLTPTWQGECLSEFSPELLYNEGIRGVMFDLDNTLIIPKNNHVPDTVQQWLIEAQAKEIKLCIVTNNTFSKHRKRAEENLKIPVFGPAGKPRRKYLLEAMGFLGLEPEQILMVGDRPLTDILGGHRVGVRTLLLKPLSRHIDPPHVHILRFLESLVVKAQ